ncbi:MAG: DUF4157 domain-containing protein [Stenomitos frigidus ULC029]
MQTRSSHQRHSHSESSDRVIATPKPRSWSDPHQHQATQPQPIRHDFSHVDLFAHDPGPRTIDFGIQPKLTVGAPNDVYEQEADRVAAQVVQRLNAPLPNPSSPARSQSDLAVQRETLPDDEELQMKPLADQIQRVDMPEEEELQMKPMADQIQRVDMPEEEELQMKSMVQRQTGEEAVTASANLESSIQQARNGGQPLADTIRQPMEQAFGADFSRVKVHTDTQSDQLNRSIQAKAFTTGQDVFFRQGAYEPGSRGGQELIAHELTHVVQQNGGAVQRSQLQPSFHDFSHVDLFSHAPQCCPIQTKLAVPAIQNIQRSIGPISHRSPVIQRYFLHTPGAMEATPAHYQAQEKRPGSTDFLNLADTAPNIDVPRAAPGGGGGVGAPQIPQLRVSQDGNLAIEATNLTQRQSKVFFADPVIVAQSNARLLEQASPYRLQIDTPNALTLNTALPNPVFAGKQLARVTPRAVVGVGGAGIGMDLMNDYCNQVAESITQSGTLGGQAKVVGQDTLIPPADAEYRVARYITDRKGGMTHAQAVANLNSAVGAAQRPTISSQYSEIVEPAIKTGKDIETHLNATLGINYWATTDAALASYLRSRNRRRTHANSLAPLAGLALTPQQQSQVEVAYNSAKIPEIANAILLNADVTRLVPNHLGMAPTVTIEILKKYVRLRLEGGLSADVAFSQTGLGDPGVQRTYATAVDTQYGLGLAAAAAFTAFDLRNSLKVASPDLGLEYKIEPYVRARHGGATHVAAGGAIAAAVLPLPVTNNLDAAYSAVIAGYPRTPVQMAGDLQTALQDLGVNQYAAPEIGQIFGSSMTGMPDGSGRVAEYKTGKSKNASSEGWSSHYGSVVAKSGGDSITLENYARVAENGGAAAGATQEYYFQMYGSALGQSWHDTWTNAGRSVMNAVTTVFGEDKQSLWKGQLDAIPAPVTGINIPNYGTLLTNQKTLIDLALNPTARQAAYYNALDVLTLASLQRHRQVADATGYKASLGAHLTAINLFTDVPTVTGELTTWINHYQGKLANKWSVNVVGKQLMTNKIQKLQGIQTKLNALDTFRTDRRV